MACVDDVSLDCSSSACPVPRAALSALRVCLQNSASQSMSHSRTLSSMSRLTAGARTIHGPSPCVYAQCQPRRALLGKPVRDFAHSRAGSARRRRHRSCLRSRRLLLLTHHRPVRLPPAHRRRRRHHRCCRCHPCPRPQPHLHRQRCHRQCCRHRRRHHRSPKLRLRPYLRALPTRRSKAACTGSCGAQSGWRVKRRTKCLLKR